MADPLKEIDRVAKEGRERKSSDPIIKFFQAELEAARNRERKWRREAARIIDIYEAKRADDNTFNILYSNTEVLLPVLYSGSPRPVVERAFHDPDPLAKAGAEVIERTLKFLIRQRGEYSPFSALMTKSVLGACLPGRGITQFEYDADIQSRPSTLGNSKEDEAASSSDGDSELRKAKLTEEGEEAVEVPKDVEGVAYETVCGCNWEYDKVLMGYATEWAYVPWVSFEYFMTREDLLTNFPDKKTDDNRKVAEIIPVEEPSRKDETDQRNRDDLKEDNLGTIKGARVYCIWWKTKKKILFYAPSYPDVILKEIDDPLGLSTFYNFPAPLTLVVKYNPQVPTPLYKMYEQQAKELNRLSKRINRLCEALKVRGLYDGVLGDQIKSLLASDDNTFLPARNTQQLAEKPNLANFIWPVPIDQVITALRECITARESCKQTIYEIMGIADIMRAQSGPYDTASAVNLKNKWGTLRISKGQSRVQNYIRDSLQILAEIACKHFSWQTFKAMTNLDYSSQEEVQQAQQMVQQINSQMQMMQLSAQQPPLGGAPPSGAQPGGQQQPPQPSPQMQQAMQQAQEVLAKPQWEQVVALLRNDVLRNYRIDIETDSTLASETQATQEEVNSSMQALATMYQSFLPAVQEGAMTMPALKQMTLTVVRRLPFGKQLEDAVQSMPDQLPQQQDPAADAKAQQAQADLQMANLKLQKAQRDDQRDQVEHQNKMQAMQRDEEMQQKEHQVTLAENDSKIQQAELDVQLKREMNQAEREKMLLDLEIKRAERDLKLQQAAAGRAQAQAAQTDAAVKKRNAARPPVDFAQTLDAAFTKHMGRPRKVKINRDLMGNMSDAEIN